MSKISTDDCKNFLKASFPKQNKWKRIKKYKNEAGQWCRDFESESGFSTTLVEINEQLTLISQEQKEIDCFYYKKFSNDEIKLAKKLVDNFVKSYYNDNGYEELNHRDAGYNAIPNCFEFFIDYGAEDLNAGTLIEEDSYKSFDFGVFFRPIGHDFDQHLDGILSDFLPKYMPETMECVFEATPKTPMTIKELIQMLSDRGFTYNQKDCAMAEVFKTYKVLPKV